MEKKKSIHFGSNVSITFVEGASIQKINNYLNWHSVNEDWNSINPGSLSAAESGSKSPFGLFQRVYYGVIVMILKKI